MYVFSALGESGRLYGSFFAENFHRGVKCALRESDGRSLNSSLTRSGRSSSHISIGEGIRGSESVFLRGTIIDNLRPGSERERFRAHSIYASRERRDSELRNPKIFLDESDSRSVCGSASGTMPSFISESTICGFGDQKTSIQSSSRISPGFPALPEASEARR